MVADKHASEDTEEENKREDRNRLWHKIYREAMRLSIINSVRRNCPSLIEITEKKVAGIHRMTILENLAIDVYEEADEKAAMYLLDEAVFEAKGYLHPDPEEPHMDAIIAQLNVLRNKELQQIEVLQRVVVKVVEVRFPKLVELANEQIQLVDQLKVLETILPQLAAPSDEKRVRNILNLLPGYSVSWD